MRGPAMVAVGCSGCSFGVECRAVRALCTLKFLILVCMGFLIPTFVQNRFPNQGL